MGKQYEETQSSLKNDIWWLILNVIKLLVFNVLWGLICAVPLYMYKYRMIQRDDPAIVFTGFMFFVVFILNIWFYKSRYTKKRGILEFLLMLYLTAVNPCMTILYYLSVYY